MSNIRQPAKRERINGEEKMISDMMEKKYLLKLSFKTKLNERYTTNTCVCTIYIYIYNMRWSFISVNWKYPWKAFAKGPFFYLKTFSTRELYSLASNQILWHIS